MDSVDRFHRSPGDNASGKCVCRVRRSSTAPLEADVALQIGKLRASIGLIRRLVGGLDGRNPIMPAAVETEMLAAVAQLRAPVARIRRFAGAA